MSNRRISVQHAIQSKQNPRCILLQILTNAVKVQRAAWELEAASLGVPSRGKGQGVSVTLGSITVWFLGRTGTSQYQPLYIRVTEILHKKRGEYSLSAHLLSTDYVPRIDGASCHGVTGGTPLSCSC